MRTAGFLTQSPARNGGIRNVKDVCPGLSDWKALDACAAKFATARPATKILIYTGSLDNPAPNVPTWHLGVESQMPWLDIQHTRKRVRCQDSPDVVEAWAAFNMPVP